MGFDPQSNLVPGRADPASIVSGYEAESGRRVSTWLVVGVVLLATAAAVWMALDVPFGIPGPRGTQAAPPRIRPDEPGMKLLLQQAPVIVEPRDREAEPIVVQPEPPREMPIDSDAEESREAYAEGLRLVSMGRHREAIERLRRAVELDPTFAPARYKLALAYIASGRLAEARGELIELEALDANLASLLENLLR
jgi:hypothetical protein